MFFLLSCTLKQSFKVLIAPLCPNNVLKTVSILIEWLSIVQYGYAFFIYISTDVVCCTRTYHNTNSCPVRAPYLKNAWRNGVIVLFLHNFTQSINFLLYHSKRFVAFHVLPSRPVSNGECLSTFGAYLSIRSQRRYWYCWAKVDGLRVGFYQQTYVRAHTGGSTMTAFPNVRDSG